jgi:hypothetical protein
MTRDIPEEPPGENEAFESFDEALDDEDAVSGDPGGGHEAARDLDTELVVDETELEEAGANLDDPERISLLDGGMDDPDGSGPPPRRADEAGWNLDPEDAMADEEDDDRPIDEPEESVDPALEITDTDATDLDQVPDDAPGPDSARW